MSLKPSDIAILIPRKYRDHIIAENLIYKAIPSGGDAHMRQLVIIWANYIEVGSHIDETCPICLRRLLDNFRAMEEALVELSMADKLLDL